MPPAESPGDIINDGVRRAHLDASDILRRTEIPMRDFSMIAQHAEENRQLHSGFAHIMYERLMSQIAQFEEALAPDEQVGAYLAAFGKEVHVAIEGVGYHNPYFIIFYGRLADESGSRVQLVQHVTQINVLLIAVKLKPDEKPTRIGFRPAEPNDVTTPPEAAE